MDCVSETESIHYVREYRSSYESLMLMLLNDFTDANYENVLPLLFNAAFSIRCFARLVSDSFGQNRTKC